ncbi:MAG: ABC transporter ATP-binding protein, partial [Candidatus Electrothrix sp. AR3]|nr:ABC transporter ATP-binding protein [Candidatus Electrothrix sp. AR3]
MLSINNLSLQYGSKHIFRDVSAQIHANDRIGLSGVNGTGKSTLMKLICNALESDPGVISRASWFTVAYLPQEISIELGQRSLFAEAENAFDEVLRYQEEIEQIGEQLSTLNQDS